MAFEKMASPTQKKLSSTSKQKVEMLASKEKISNQKTVEDNDTKTINKVKKEKSDKKLKEKTYKNELKKLQIELVRLQEWVQNTNSKICIIFEGRDGAGKGGTIKFLTERLNPRVVRVVALPKPTEKEKTQWYFQRYVSHLPAAGEIVIFDRSWYNRAGVEKVMGFCTEKEMAEFLEQVPFMERNMVASGIKLLKYWLEVDQKEQEKRMQARIDDPRKTWKLSDMDLESYRRWYDYSRARDEMFKASDSSWAPWFVVNTNCKRSAHLNIARHILGQIPYKKISLAKVKLPKRQDAKNYREPDYPYHNVPEHY